MNRNKLFVGFWDNINAWSNNGNMLSKIHENDHLLIFQDNKRVVVSSTIRSSVEENPNIELVCIEDDLGKEFCNWISAKIDSVSNISTIVYLLGIDEIDKRRQVNYREELTKRISKAFEIRNASSYGYVLKFNKIVSTEEDLKNRRRAQFDAQSQLAQDRISEFNSEIDQDENELEDAFNNAEIDPENALENSKRIAEAYAPEPKPIKTKEPNPENREPSKPVAQQESKAEPARGKQNDEDKKINHTVQLPSSEELDQAARQKEEEKKRIAVQKDLEIQELERKILNQDDSIEEIQKTISGMESSKAMVIYYAAEDFIQDAEKLSPTQIPQLGLRQDLSKTFEFISQIAKTVNAEGFIKSWNSYCGGSSLSLDEKAFQYLKRKADDLLTLCNVLYR